MENSVKKQIPKWKEKSTVEKSLTMLGLILAISIIILSTLSFLESGRGLIKVTELLLGLMMLVQTLQLWKYNKFAARFSLVVALFSFGVAIVLFFFR